MYYRPELYNIRSAICKICDNTVHENRKRLLKDLLRTFRGACSKLLSSQKDVFYLHKNAMTVNLIY